MDSSRNLIEFRAGKMNLSGTKVVADKRKGIFYIHRERESMLTHVCWKDRNTGRVEDDLIVFPDDCKWTRVTQCTTGRVYLLRFTSSSKKLFFWMQEPKDTKDEEYTDKVNKILNDPDDPSLSSGTAGGGAGGNPNDLLGMGGSAEQLLSQMFGAAGAGGTSQQEMLQQLFQSGALGNRLQAATSNIQSTGSGFGSRAAGSRSGVSRGDASSVDQAASAVAANGSSSSGSGSNSNTSRGGPAAPAGGASSRPITNQSVTPMQMEQFQDIMTNLSSQAANRSAGVNLASALPLDVKSLLSSPEIISGLSEHVPKHGEVKEGVSGGGSGSGGEESELRQSLGSPQFRQSLALFSSAFLTGQLGPLISQFNLGPQATQAANSGNLKAFIDALNESAAASKDDTRGASSAAGEEQGGGEEKGSSAGSTGGDDQMDTE